MMLHITQCWTLLASIISPSLAQPTSQTASPIVRTSLGSIRGANLNGTVNQYLGIPFAQPPIGPLRFQPAVRYPAWGDTATLNATTFGKSCYQFSFALPGVGGANGSRDPLGIPLSEQSEDCLTLNVFVPAGAGKKAKRGGKAKPLPVFFWVYGGAFAEGASSTVAYHPQKFIEETGDIIVVTPNYRLGLWGFPNSPALATDGQNLGIRDVRLALEWTRAHIVSFGGDPLRIVMSGQSAGAGQTDINTFAFADDPIASAALLTSGTVALSASVNGAVSDSEFRRVAGVVGCQSEDRARELECMRGVDAVRLKQAVSNASSNAFGDGSGGGPMVDNVTVFSIPEYQRKAAAGEFAHIPTFLGTTAQEGDSLTTLDPDGTINRTASDATTQLMFNCPAAFFAAARSKLSIPTWRYRFSGVFRSLHLLPDMGAYHGEDVFLLWNSIDTLAPGLLVPSADEVAAAKYLQKAYADFIRDPKQGLLRKGWPLYEKEKKTLVELFKNETVGAELVNGDEYDKDCKAFGWNV